MKKIINSCLILLLCFSLIGCSNNSSSGNNNNTEQNEIQDLEIVDSQYLIEDVSTSSSYYVHFVCIVKNPNTEYTGKYPDIIVTYYDDEDNIIISTSEIISIIAPGETVALAMSYTFSNDQRVARVEFKSNAKDKDFVENKTVPVIDNVVFSNINPIISDGYLTLSGQVENVSETNYDTLMAVAVFYKDNQIVFSASNFINNLYAEDILPFTLLSFYSEEISEDSYDRYELFIYES